MYPQVLTGHPAREIPTELPQTKIPAVEEYLDDLICRNQEASDALILGRARTADTVSDRRNPNAIPRVGDHVVYRRRTFNGKSKKLHTVWDGPHEVIGYNEDTGNCHLRLPASKKVHPWFATDKLRIYLPVTHPSIWGIILG